MKFLLIRLLGLGALVITASAGTANAAWFSDHVTPGTRDIDVRTAVGRHFWDENGGFLRSCVALTTLPCLGSASEYYSAGTGFTVVDVVRLADKCSSCSFAKIRLDDGRVGFISPGQWETEEERAVANAKTAAFNQALKVRTDASIRALDEKLGKLRAEHTARDAARAARDRDDCGTS